MTRLPLYGVLASLWLTGSGCSEAECATPDYSRAECRVVAENDFARVLTSAGVELRFQNPDASEDESWVAQGLLRERDQRVEARVAHMGPFAISLRGSANADTVVELELSNVHPLAEISVGPLGAELPQPSPASGLRRSLSIPVAADELVWVRGVLPCPTTFRLAVVGDVQTNPTQFARIIDRLQREASDAEAQGELLAGVLMPGDLTESSTEDEFHIFADLLEPAVVPFALTPGNHDVYDSHLPFFNQNFGPGNYAFDVCRAHVAMLDSGSGHIAPSVEGRLHQLFDRGSAGFSLTAMHHPPFPGLTAAGWSSEDQAMTMLGEFAFQGGDLILAGHAHLLRSMDVPVAGTTIPQLIVGTGGASQGAGPPIYGYVRLRFTSDDRIERCFVEVPPPGAQLSESLPKGFEACTDP